MPGGRTGRSRSISKRVARILEQEIVAGTLAAGARIAEQATAERLGVSRVPVREATIALERDGLLVRSATGRLRVADLDDHDMAEILEVRRIIEPEVVRAAAARHRPDDIAALERNLAGLAAARDLTRISLFDAEFHDLMAGASHQTRLIQVWNLLRGQFLLWIACSQRRLVLTTDEVRRSTLTHHTAMVGLVRAHDARGAERYVRDLLASAADELRDAPARDVRSRP
jgi:DNA-binding GntR family transcriptional regulator